ncbi:MAG: methyltransferase domain-containing protein [Acidobacteria bacterium]|nr:methyltransferase domain-containing protein [Acidobacteriota bacterium]
MKMSALLLILSCAAWSQVATNANTGYRTEEGRARLANTLAASDRDGRQKPVELVAAMQLKPGQTVIDLGTGVGYMLPHLVKAVGPTGKVIAMDIFPDFLKKAREAAAKDHLTNVDFVLGTDQDPRLPADSADAVLILDAYHHFDYPEKSLAGIAKALHPGGRLFLVDFYKSGFRDPAHIRLDQADVIKEVEANGFTFERKMDHQEKVQYIAVFRKK